MLLLYVPISYGPFIKRDSGCNSENKTNLAGFFFIFSILLPWAILFWECYSRLPKGSIFYLLRPASFSSYRGSGAASPSFVIFIWTSLQKRYFILTFPDVLMVWWFGLNQGYCIWDLFPKHISQFSNGHNSENMRKLAFFTSDPLLRSIFWFSKFFLTMSMPK